MKLNFKKTGSGKPLIILHGLLGSLDNWLTFGRKMGESGFEVYMTDARNHGQSPWSDEWSFNAMAEDIAEFMKDEGLEKADILGHSMGGKTAMLFASENPVFVNKLIIADIAPKKYKPHHEEILDALKSVNVETVGSRQEAEEKLSSVIKEKDVVMFLMKSLYRKGKDQFGWRFNLDVISEKYDKVIENPVDNAFNGPALFIRGSKSRYISDEDIDRIKSLFPESELETLDAGHWLHAEKPDEFFGLCLNFLSDKQLQNII